MLSSHGLNVESKGNQQSDQLQHGVVQDKLYKGESSPELTEVVFETASRAKMHLEHAKEMLPTLPKGATKALISYVRLLESEITYLGCCR